MSDGALNGIRRKVVNNWIKAAVGHCYAQRDGVDGSDHMFCIASLQDVRADHGVEHEVDIVGNETEAEDEQMHEDHPQNFGLVKAPSTADGLRFPQCPKHHDRAKHIDHQRDDEAHGLNKHHHLGQLSLPLAFGVVFKAEV